MLANGDIVRADAGEHLLAACSYSMQCLPQLTYARFNNPVKWQRLRTKRACCQHLLLIAYRLPPSCAAENNPDLFWASCGAGGGTWGVVTELEVKISTLPNEGRVTELSVSCRGSPTAKRGLTSRRQASPCGPPLHGSLNSELPSTGFYQADGLATREVLFMVTAGELHPWQHVC